MKINISLLMIKIYPIISDLNHQIALKDLLRAFGIRYKSLNYHLGIIIIDDLSFDDITIRTALKHALK